MTEAMNVGWSPPESAFSCPYLLPLCGKGSKWQEWPSVDGKLRVQESWVIPLKSQSLDQAAEENSQGTSIWPGQGWWGEELWIPTSCSQEDGEGSSLCFHGIVWANQKDQILGSPQDTQGALYTLAAERKTQCLACESECFATTQQAPSSPPEEPSSVPEARGQCKSLLMALLEWQLQPSAPAASSFSTRPAGPGPLERQYPCREAIPKHPHGVGPRCPQQLVTSMAGMMDWHNNASLRDHIVWKLLDAVISQQAGKYHRAHVELLGQGTIFEHTHTAQCVTHICLGSQVRDTYGHALHSVSKLAGSSPMHPPRPSHQAVGPPWVLCKVIGHCITPQCSWWLFPEPTVAEMITITTKLSWRECETLFTGLMMAAVGEALTSKSFTKSSHLIHMFLAVWHHLHIRKLRPERKDIFTWLGSVVFASNHNYRKWELSFLFVVEVSLRMLTEARQQPWVRKMRPGFFVLLEQDTRLLCNPGSQLQRWSSTHSAGPVLGPGPTWYLAGSQWMAEMSASLHLVYTSQEPPRLPTQLP